MAPKKDPVLPNNGLAGTATILRDNAVREFGESYVKTTDAFRHILRGVPLQGLLPLQYLAGIDIVPVHRILGVVGPWGSTKSTFAWELGRLFIQQGGMLIHIETESKPTDDQPFGLFPDEAFFDKVVIHHAKDADIESCFGSIVWYCQQYEKACPARNVPLMIVLDSLNALISKEAKEASETGTDPSGYHDARRAGLIKQKLQYINNTHLQNNPITFCIVNHQSADMKSDSSGKPGFSGGNAKKEPGGGYKDYQTSLKLVLRKSAPQRRSGLKHPVIKMNSGKTAFGPERNKPIEIPFLSEWVTEPRGMWKIRYDWDAALVYIIADQLLKENTEGFIDVTGTGNKYSCPQVDMKGVTASELGHALQADEAMVDILKDHVLRIMRKEVIVG